MSNFNLISGLNPNHVISGCLVSLVPTTPYGCHLRSQLMSNDGSTEKPALPEELQSRLGAALTSASKRTRAPGSLLSSFADQTDVLDTEKSNKFNLLCPREGCSSTILLKGVAKWDVKDTTDPIDSGSHSLPAALPALEHSAPTSWWHITGSPMAFENISFTKPIAGTENNAVPRKLLACAECDLGPIGWAEGTDYWLVANRVAYKV